MSERDLRDEPVAHRTGDTDPSGKKTVRLEILLTEQMHDDLIAVATIRKLPKAEYARACIEAALYGALEIMRRSVQKSDE